MCSIQTIKASVKPRMVTINSQKLQIESRLADGFFSRLRGLLWAEPLSQGEGLLLKPCNSVHTIGMAYSIDVVFLSPDLQVVSMVSHCQPNRFASNKNAKHTLELLAGQAEALGIKIGMQLTIDLSQQTTGKR